MGRRRARGRVRDLVVDGRSVVETEHGVVFAPLGVPGDEVELERHPKKRDRGRIVQVLEPSADRREPPCPLVNRCGGCPWMPVSESLQREHKERFVEKATGQRVSLRQAQMLAYRSRARLAWDSMILGYRSRSSHRIVDTERCEVLTPVLSRAWAEARSRLKGALKGKGELLLAERDGRAALALRAQSPQTPELYQVLEGLVGETIAGVELRVDDAAPARWGEPRERTEAVDGEPLEGTVGGFSQAHQTLNRDLVNVVVEMARPAGLKVLELFAGHGNLSVMLARQAEAFTAVELDAEAAAALRDNLLSRSLRGKVVTADAERWPKGKWDVVVLDPPRTGAREVCARLSEERPSRIVYVSCNPGTLGRDLALLKQAGYQIDAVEAFDMFPQTPHVETVVGLLR